MTAETMATRTFSIAAIPADGVGTEVVAAGRAVLDALAAHSGGSFAFDWTEFPWGCGYYEKTGRMMDADGLEVLQQFDAIYFRRRRLAGRPGPRPPRALPPRRRLATAQGRPPTSTGSSSGRSARAS